MAHLTFTDARSQARIDRIQHFLRQQPATLQELADALFMSLRLATLYVDHLQATGQMHVCEFRRYKRQSYTVWKSIYAWGPGADAPPPDRSKRAHEARRRAEIAADADRHDREKARRRAAKIKPHRDWTASWIPTR